MMHLACLQAGAYFLQSICCVSFGQIALCPQWGPLSISTRPGSAAPLPVSTASTGLRHLLVAAHVHRVRSDAEKYCVWLLLCTHHFQCMTCIYIYIYYIYLYIYIYNVYIYHYELHSALLITYRYIGCIHIIMS